MNQNPTAHSAWFWLRSGPSAAAFNMAQDEALLESMPQFRCPVLRFYAWSEPAASFGYFQKYRDVEQWTTLRPLIRRPTGGGIVPHDADWTYSVVFPTHHEWYSVSATESYRRIHRWIQLAFERIGLKTELAPDPFKPVQGQCFAGHERCDLLFHGRKIAGAAQRRRKDGLLIQGSVQPPRSSLERVDWEKAMLESGIHLHSASWKPCPEDSFYHQRTTELAREKYAQSSYNQGR